MLSTVALIDLIGRDASLKQMGKTDFADFINNNAASAEVSQALIAGDADMLSNLVYAHSKGCYLLVPYDQDSQDEIPPANPYKKLMS